MRLERLTDLTLTHDSEVDQPGRGKCCGNFC